MIVEHGGTFGSEATGGVVAAPIARQVLAVALVREHATDEPPCRTDDARLQQCSRYRDRR